MRIPIIAMIGSAHIIYGISIYISPGIALITSLSELWYLTGGAAWLILFITGLLAVASYSLSNVPVRILLIVPQQTVVTIQFSSLIFTLATGHYPDGYTPKATWPALFILNDQLCSLFAWIAHSLEAVSIARSE